MNENKTVDFEELAGKCLKQVKNKLYFHYKSLSPAIYRMPVEYLEAGSGMFGTDANRIYADPMSVIMRYKNSPDGLVRTYLHMLFHCIYLHPFVTKYGVDNGVWNIALDICAEAAVLRLDPTEIDGDKDRKNIINQIKGKIKMFLPELVYKELTNNKKDYDFMELVHLFHMDDHIWLQQNQGNQGNSNGDNDEDNDYQNPNQQPQQQPGNGNNDNDSNEDNQNQDGNGNGNDKNNKNQNQNQNQNGNGNGKSNQKNNQSPSQSRAQQQKKQEWSDVSRQVAADMQSFHQQGTGSGDTIQEIDFLTQDKMEYDEFLRQFSVMEEKMMVNMDEFDYMFYMHGMNMKMPGDKKMLLIEPLEYKEEKVIKDFVIAIDTSGSCSGELVKRFLNKTYSILKETENFSSRVNIHIIQCDAQIQNDTKITNMDEMDHFMQNLKLYGFGGTDFRPVFQYVDDLVAKKEFENLCGLIYFTDGYGTYPTKPTQYKTAFAFLEDYNHRDVPPWAMSVYWTEDEK